MARVKHLTEKAGRQSSTRSRHSKRNLPGKLLSAERKRLAVHKLFEFVNQIIWGDDVELLNSSTL
jgi:hypothetical protein